MHRVHVVLDLVLLDLNFSHFLGYDHPGYVVLALLLDKLITLDSALELHLEQLIFEVQLFDVQRIILNHLLNARALLLTLYLSLHLVLIGHLQLPQVHPLLQPLHSVFP